MVDIKDLGHDLRALDAMNRSRFWLRVTSLGHELEALYAMNRL